MKPRVNCRTAPAWWSCFPAANTVCSRCLLERPNRALNRDQLLTLTQGRETDPLDRSIDLHISRLRQKLGDDARAPKLIKTLRNEGYMLAATVKRGE